MRHPLKVIITPALCGLSLFLLAAQVLEAQTFRTDDPVLRQMWVEGTERSQVEPLAQVLMDSIGPRLSGSPGFDESADWLIRTYGDWGIEVRREEYGTWRGWRQGHLHVDMTSPRIQTLEAKLLAWSPGTSGPIEGDVVLVPEPAPAQEVRSWLQTIEGKIVLASPPEPTCREPQTLERLARPETVERIRDERQALRISWALRMQALGDDPHRRLEEAGAVAVITSRWSEGWGVNKIFDAGTASAVSIDLSCEDYGLVYRLADRNQGARLRIDAQAEDLGTVPTYNIMAEIRGTELPDEYVMLSAHLDSWHGATGATDNGTGTITMLEAMRILRATYPNPRRTILVGHWGGEEQGLIGSRAFAEDNPEVVENLQALFNQDNGTWRVDYIQSQGLLGASGHLARWVASLPTEISGHIELDLPGPQEIGGSDHVAFLCYGAPGWRLQSHYPEYRQYTWHTNRDTFDKIVLDDVMNNATLAAMLAYLASEDPERVPRDRALLPVDPRTGEPRDWLPCREARRSWER
jgi:carboxypeptidase Q